MSANWSITPHEWRAFSGTTAHRCQGGTWQAGRIKDCPDCAVKRPTPTVKRGRES